MAATVNGTPVNFSFQSAAGITITEISGILLQNASYKKNSNRTMVKSGEGDRVTSVHNDRFNSATLRWVVSGTNLAGAITNTTLTQPGNFVTITACATMPDIVHASNKWEVITGEVTGSNDGVKEISMEIEYAAGIQAVAS
jgi:hypothetical protein